MILYFSNHGIVNTKRCKINRFLWTGIVLIIHGFLPFLGEGLGAAEGADEKRLEKNFSARIAFAASEGWKASQNTYSVRLLHNFEFGKHKPPMLVSTLQQEVFETLKPVELLNAGIKYRQKKKRHIIAIYQSMVLKLPKAYI